MKKIIFILFILLSMNVYSLQYIGYEKLDIINTDNNITSLYHGENITINGDYEFILYEYKYVYAPSTIMNDVLSYMPYLVGILFIAICIIIIVQSIKNLT